MTKRDRAVEIGQRVARHFFAKRGNNSEVHLSELQLAALLAFAVEQATDEHPDVLEAGHGINIRYCTCLGTCKGKEGLAAGWRCALDAQELTPTQTRVPAGENR